MGTKVPVSKKDFECIYGLYLQWLQDKAPTMFEKGEAREYSGDYDTARLFRL